MTPDATRGPFRRRWKGALLVALLFLGIVVGWWFWPRPRCPVVMTVQCGPHVLPYAPAFSQNGARLAVLNLVGGGMPRPSKGPGRVDLDVLEVPSGRHLLNAQHVSQEIGPTHFSNDDQILYFDDSHLPGCIQHCWRIADRRELLPHRQRRSTPGFRASVSSIGLDDVIGLASPYGRVDVEYDLFSTDHSWIMTLPVGVQRKLGDWFGMTVKSRTGLILRDARTRHVVADLGRDAPTHAFAFSPDGNRLAVMYADGKILVYDVSSLR